ncbi:hypothetical protein QJ48_08540 [Paenibacillus sp. A3]|uniref:hypothetical protein n=1 Tax=Paenibacillus sp. A3 TaxID=1337054 RepID=UPI0006D58201|nr:hypothetical protein QJ48_08540 [Paenibacillus sp. A3]
MRNYSTGRYMTVLLGAVALILIAAYLSLTNGAFDMTVGDIVRTLLGIDPQPALIGVPFFLYLIRRKGGEQRA